MKPFDLLPSLIVRARKSPFWLGVLNRVLWLTIPFNRPHRFRVVSIAADRVVTTAAYRRINHNHVRGIHACAIATIAEFSAGFLLLTRLDPSRYRLIMARIEVDYHYQAKEDIVSESFLAAERLNGEVIEPLKEQESVTVRVESRVTDGSGNDIATAWTTWQIKRWDRVRTAV